MIGRFRKRFILISLALVGVISFAAFFAIGFMTYLDLKSEVDVSLDRALDPDAMKPEQLPQLGGGHRGGDHLGNGKGSMGRIPVFSVTVLASEPETIYVSMASTAHMDESTSVEAVKTALQSPSEEGTLSQFGLFYKKEASPFGWRIAFASTDAVFDAVVAEGLRLLVYWVVLMVALFAVIMFLARYVTRPVERAWEEQQRFIADASHELKTPLTIIMADASILADNPEKTVAEQQVWVEGISAEAERMRLLTEDLLTLAQADAGVDVSQVMSELDLSSLVEAQALQFEAVAFERGLEIEADVEEGLVVDGDELRIEGTVKTLLENACKYSAKPGVIAVRLQRIKNQAVLSVHNDGEPIPEADLERLFNRFYRSDKARASEGESASFGLGLSIAKANVELHGGTIAAASGEEGTTFTVTLPLGKR